MQSPNQNTKAGSFAMYKLPGSPTCHSIRTEPEELHDTAAMDGRDGFILAPFAESAATPILIFAGEEETFPPPAAGRQTWRPPDPGRTADAQARAAYGDAFRALHSMLERKELNKVVLARSRTMPQDLRAEAEEIFYSACRENENGYVAIAATPKNGIWLTITPELLTMRDGKTMKTMALAGTMSPGECEKRGWSEKNKREQGVVSNYIMSTLAPLAKNIQTDGGLTLTTRGLAHLQTKFTFTPYDGIKTSDVVSALHPTPAVCGMPKDSALRAILTTERCRREYYSGYSGPIRANGDASLYVTLRCAKISEEGWTLYAGGGLMPESTEQDEWDETEAKMEAVKAIITQK